jgi:steroid delta-isomerase-like uncharacterized protein
MVEVGGQEMASTDPIRKMVAAFNDRTVDQVAGELIAPGFVRHDLAEPFRHVEGPEGLRDFLGTVVAAMPDAQIRIEELFGTDDRAVLRYVLVGTHTRDPVLGVPASGRRVEVQGINIYRVEKGRIAETWQLSDVLGVYRALGVVPT